MKSPATLFAYQTMAHPKHLNSRFDERKKTIHNVWRLRWVKLLLLFTWR